jgi:hypothetical protein
MTVWQPRQPKPSDPLWRYLDLPKFVWMLQKQAMFLPTLERLRQSDKMEGHFPPESYRDSLDEERRSHDIELLSEAQHDELQKSMSTVRDREKYWNVISCWHQSDDESQAMWNLYKATVALCSTVQRLNDSFRSRSTFQRSFGLVNYIRHDLDRPKWQSPVQAMFHKDISLKHEQEFRLLFFVPGNRNEQGKEMLVDIETLITCVVVSPFTDDWMLDLVTDLMSKYGFGKIPVHPSRLRTPPKSL